MSEIICGDCLEEMEKLDEDSVDLVIADPPFNILEPDAKKSNIRWDKGSFENMENFLDFTSNWLKECYRLLREDSQLYLFWSQKWMKEFWNLKQPFEIKRMLIWNNPCRTGGFTSNQYLWNYTPVFYLTKGEVRSLNASFSREENVDVFRFPAPQSNFEKDKQYHPTQKPLELIRIFVNNSSDRGDVVLDPFLGAGTTALVCEELNREYIGIEIQEEYVELAKRRLSRPVKLEEFC